VDPSLKTSVAVKFWFWPTLSVAAAGWMAILTGTTWAVGLGEGEVLLLPPLPPQPASARTNIVRVSKDVAWELLHSNVEGEACILTYRNSGGGTCVGAVEQSQPQFPAIN
jgi:hypothetical protein